MRKERENGTQEEIEKNTIKWIKFNIQPMIIIVYAFATYRVVVNSNLTSENVTYVFLFFFTSIFGMNFRTASTFSGKNTHAWVSSLISFVYIWTKVLINSIQLPIVKLAGPDPTIGRMMTLPLTLYFPTSDNSWALTWSSNLDVVGSLPNPLFEKLIISFCYWQRWTHNRPFTYTTLFTTMLLRP